MTENMTTTPSPEEAVAAVEGAEADGTLSKLQALMDEFGWDTTAGTLLLLAQKDDRTQGKSPDELEAMIRAEPSLYDDLEAYKPGGKLDRGEPEEAPADEEPPAEGGPDMGAFVEGSSSFKGADPKKAFNAMKKSGAEKPEDLDESFDQKADFMRRMAK